MNRPISNQLEKYELIAGLLAGNKPLISIEKALSYTTSKFSNLIKNMRRLEMDKNIEKQKSLLSSVIIKDELSSELIKYLSVLKKHQKKTSPATLPSQVKKITRSSILKLDGKRLLELGWVIYEICENDPAVLGKINTGEGSLSKLKLKINRYRDLLASQRREKIIQELNEAGFDSMFFKAEKMLDIMEGRIEYLGLEYKDLYEDYVAVRRTGNKKHGSVDIKFCM